MASVTAQVTTNVQDAWDGKAGDWDSKDALVFELKDGDNGGLQITESAKSLTDIVLRAVSGAKPQLTTGGDVPVRVVPTEGEASKRLRLVIDARSDPITTDAERKVIGTWPNGLPQYEGTKRTAIDANGLSEAIFLGSADLRDKDGGVAITRIRFGGKLVLNGDQVRNLLTECAITVFCRQDLETHTYVPPKG